MDSECRKICFASFNQDASSLIVGLDGSGYTLFSFSSEKSLDVLHSSHHLKDKDVIIAERLFECSLLAIVTCHEPRKLRLVHFRKGTDISSYSYSSNILSVKLNRSRLIVCLEETLLIHNLRDMRILHTIQETPINNKGLIALSSKSETDDCNVYLAFPGHSTLGEVNIFDAVNMSTIASIPAHTSPVSAMTFNANNDLLATASEKGTVIRVFRFVYPSVESNQPHNSSRCLVKVCEFRRGITRTVQIKSLSFSPCSKFLACSSNTSTIHIFKLDDVTSSSGERSDASTANDNGYNQDSSWSSTSNMLSSMIDSVAQYVLPTQVNEALFVQSRAYLTAYVDDIPSSTASDTFTDTVLSNSIQSKICALTIISNKLRLLVVCKSSGQLYIFDVNDETQRTQKLDETSCELIHKCDLRLICEKEEEKDKKSGQSSNSSSGDGDDLSYSDRVKDKKKRGGGENAKIEDEESEKFYEMGRALENPPKKCFLLEDDSEFPPVN